MGPFTEVVFQIKTMFSDEDIARLEVINTTKERLVAVSDQIPLEIFNKLISSEDNDWSPVSAGQSAKSRQESNSNQMIWSVEALAKRLGVNLGKSSQDDDISAFSDNLAVNYQESRGRYLTAKRAIARGELVAIEEPLLMYRLHESFCEKCCQPFEKDFRINCENCDASWCSNQCKIAANSSYHKFECKMRLGSLARHESPGLVKLFMVLRSFTQRNLDHFRQHFSAYMACDPTLGANEKDKLTHSYSTLYNLTRHQPTAIQQLLELDIVAIVMLRMLESAGYFSSEELSLQQSNPFSISTSLTADHLIIGELVETLITIVNVNTHPIHGIINDNEEVLLGAALYPRCAATLNHSCNPATIRTSFGDKVLLFAGRDLQPDDELTDMYTVHWSEWQTQDRIAYLQRSFHFTCCCEACGQSWEPIDENNIRPAEFERIKQHQTRIQTEIFITKLMKTLNKQ